MLDRLQWGVIGTGAIASDFAESLTRSDRCRVVNVVGSSPAKGKAFAERFAVLDWSPDVGTLLADDAVDAVYVATPHPAHEAQAIAALSAHKHVLCEKPMTTAAATTARVIEAARSSGTFLMEAFMYRCHPLMKTLIERLQDGVIGQVRHVRADFGFRARRDPAGRLFDPALGGGGILDVGGYPVSFARLIAGLVDNTAIAEPITLTANGAIGPSGADEIATTLLTFASGFTATCTSGIYCDVGTTTVVFGEKGKIVLDDPWLPGGKRQGLQSGFTIFLDGAAPETVTVHTEKATYAIEAELVADTLPAPEAPWPAMTWADSLGNMRVLDAWRAALTVER